MNKKILAGELPLNNKKQQITKYLSDFEMDAGSNKTASDLKKHIEEQEEKASENPSYDGNIFMNFCSYGYDDEDKYIEFYYLREETDEEFQARIEKNRKAREKAKEKEETERKRIFAYDKSVYKGLMEKYGEDLKGLRDG